MNINIKTGTYIYNDEAINFNFYTDLSAAMKVRFVNSVVDVLVDETHYDSIIRDLIFDFFVVSIMTDIDTSNLETSDNFLDDVEMFLYESNIVDIVKANVSPTLFDELNTAVDKSIQYITGIRPSHINDAFASLISTLESKISEIDLSDAMGIVQKFAGMTDDFTMENLVNAYMNSDLHKKNLAEIAEAKDIEQ